MGKKLSIKDVQKLAKKKGGKCLSKKYINNHSKLKWQCEKGHKWNALYNSIKSGTWCPSCGIEKRASKQRGSIEEMKQLAKKRGGKCLAKRYVNSQTKLKWKCQNGHIWQAVPNAVKQGTWCPKCAIQKNVFRRKSNIEEMKQLAHKRGGLCLSSKYENVHAKLLWKCKKGHKWKARPSSIKRGSWCPFCAGKHITISNAKELAATRGGFCLSKKYRDSSTKMKWQCSIGHTWTTTWDVIRKSWCPQCKYHLSESIVRRYIEKMYGRSFPKTRPSWLVNDRGNRMELDLYNRNLGLAIEYQGIQHFETTRLQPSKQKLKQRIKDDLKKRKLCKKHNVLLIYVEAADLTEPLLIQEKLIKKLRKSGAPKPRRISKKAEKKLQPFTAKSEANLAELKKIAKAKKGMCLSHHYHGARRKLLFECQKGHHWYATPNNIRTGQWCRKCTKYVKKTLDDAKEMAQKKKGYLLSKKYENVHAKLLWKCKKGHKWKATLANVSRGKWCPYCAGRFVTLNVIKEFVKKKGGKCLSKKYINNSTKMEWVCSKGHTWKAQWGNIQQGTWCPSCAGRPKLTSKDTKKVAKARGGKCLSKRYKNANTKMKWQCQKRHTWMSTFNHIKRGTWCPICSRKKRKNKK
ncbi:MAG: zinc-ribbon domain-containing protein [Deltaproteobacteria bacterium]|nr:zinc-ribbon domain-containing protein [Deltaproteobacteria bacterium]